MDFQNNNQNPLNPQVPNTTPAQPAQQAQPTQPVQPAQPAQPKVDSFGYPLPQKPAQPQTQLNGQPATQFGPTTAQQPKPAVNPYSANTVPQQQPDMNFGTYRNPNAVNYNPYDPNSSQMEVPLSVGEWFITLLIMAIPCVNIIMMFVWAFGSGNKGRANYFKATLIWAAIGIVLSIIISVICASIGVSILDNLY